VRVAARVVGVEADEQHQFLDALAALGLRAEQPVDVERLADDVGDGHARVQGRIRVLEHHLHVAPVQVDVLTVDRVPVEEHLAGGRRVQVDQRAADGRLSAAGLADEAERLALVDLEAHAVDGLEHRL